MKGWKTIAFNVLGFLAFALAWPGLTEFVDPKIIAMVVVGVNFALRFITTGPVALLDAFKR